jgi:hypothetical protein
MAVNRMLKLYLPGVDRCSTCQEGAGLTTTLVDGHSAESRCSLLQIGHAITGLFTISWLGGASQRAADGLRCVEYSAPPSDFIQVLQQIGRILEHAVRTRAL